MGEAKQKTAINAGDFLKPAALQPEAVELTGLAACIGPTVWPPSHRFRVIEYKPHVAQYKTILFVWH